MDSLRDAVRHAARRLASRRMFAATVVGILALGIGIFTAAYSVVRHVLLRPIPAPHLERLIVAWEVEPAQAEQMVEVSLPYFFDWRDQSHSFSSLAAFGSVNWSYEFTAGETRPRETVSAAAVSASFFETLGVRPLLGRGFLPEQDAPETNRVVVLSYGLWQSRFAGDPGVVGSRLPGGDSVVGVMPRDFDFPRGAQAWIPVVGELEAVRRQDSMTPIGFRGLGVLHVLGRLNDDVALDSARTELSSISRRLSLADDFSKEGWSAQAVPLVDHHLGTDTRRALETLAAASGFVLLLACANVTVLLLVQALGRQTDLAVRRALGASAWGAAFQQVIEGVALAFAGGLGGTLLAYGLTRSVVALGPRELPGLRDVGLSLPVFGVAVLATLAVAVVVSLVPVGLAARLAITPALKAGSGTVSQDRLGLRLSRLLVTSEVALSLVLLVGCGLMIRSLDKLLQVELGFVPERALSFSVGLDPERYSTPADSHAFYRSLLQRLGQLPGVEVAGAIHVPPLEHGVIGSDNWVVVEGQPRDLDSLMTDSIKVNWETASPGYFRAAGTRLLEGRSFSERDAADAPRVVIVSRSLARRCWPGQSALGKRLHTWGAISDKSELKDGQFIFEWQTVVGIVEDVRFRGIQNPRLDVYLPYEQTSAGRQHVVVRTTGDPLSVAPSIRKAVKALDPDATLTALTTLEQRVSKALAPWRFTSSLLTAFAVAALVLTASGFFAVLHHFVSRRRREICIRMALGAGPRRIRRFVLTQGVQLVGAGLLLGLALSAGAARLLSSLLYQVHAVDPLSYLGAAAVLALVAAVACLHPARRAAAQDSAAALRAE